MATTKVTTGGITDATVATADIADGAVQTAKLAANAVQTSQITDAAVTLAKLEHGTSSNNGKFLRANNGADPTWETVNTDLVSDGTPQLGGNLDCNGNGIALDDSNTITLGNNSDLSIYHDGSATNVIKNNVAGKNLKIMSSDNGSLAIFNNQGDVELYNNNTKRLETITGGNSADGINVFGNASNSSVRMSTSDGTVRGIVYANSDNLVGFLGGNGSWALSVANAGGNTISYNHVNPSTDSTLDLGTNSVRWRNVYADTLYGDGSNLTGVEGVPSGVIAIWSGATANIPSGWVICDGQNSTPDLRDKFVIGASAGTGDNSYPGISPGTTGGAPHTNTTVSVNGNTGWAAQYANASSSPSMSPEPFNSRDRHQHSWGGTFTTSNFNIMPPYYALAFIMKT